MPLFTERLRPDHMLQSRPTMRTEPLSSGVRFLADLLEPSEDEPRPQLDWAESESDPEELIDTHVDQPPETLAPCPRRSQPSLVTLLDPIELGNDPIEIGNDATTRWIPKCVDVPPPSQPAPPMDPASTPVPFSLIVLDGGLDEETYAVSSSLSPTTMRRARVRRTVAYAILACVSLLGLAELSMLVAS